jgi:hypothetical protein
VGSAAVGGGTSLATAADAQPTDAPTTDAPPMEEIATVDLPRGCEWQHGHWRSARGLDLPPLYGAKKTNKKQGGAYDADCKAFLQRMFDDALRANPGKLPKITGPQAHPQLQKYMRKNPERCLTEAQVGRCNLSIWNAHRTRQAREAQATNKAIMTEELLEQADVVPPTTSTALAAGGASAPGDETGTPDMELLATNTKPESLVGARVEVLWPQNHAYHAGAITAYTPGNWDVQYDNGTFGQHDLRETTFHVVSWPKIARAKRARRRLLSSFKLKPRRVDVVEIVNVVVASAVGGAAGVDAATPAKEVALRTVLAARDWFDENRRRPEASDLHTFNGVSLTDELARPKTDSVFGCCAASFMGVQVDRETPLEIAMELFLAGCVDTDGGAHCAILSLAERGALFVGYAVETRNVHVFNPAGDHLGNQLAKHGTWFDFRGDAKVSAAKDAKEYLAHVTFDVQWALALLTT